MKFFDAFTGHDGEAVTPEFWGFQIVNTGGGCEAWMKNGKNYHILITQDLDAPLSLKEITIEEPLVFCAYPGRWEDMTNHHSRDTTCYVVVPDGEPHHRYVVYSYTDASTFYTSPGDWGRAVVLDIHLTEFGNRRPVIRSTRKRSQGSR